MTDLSLLIFGCAVSFIAVGGAYTFLRERWEEEQREAARERIRVVRRDRRDAA